MKTSPIILFFLLLFQPLFSQDAYQQAAQNFCEKINAINKEDLTYFEKDKLYEEAVEDAITETADAFEEIGISVSDSDEIDEEILIKLSTEFIKYCPELLDFLIESETGDSDEDNVEVKEFYQLMTPDVCVCLEEMGNEEGDAGMIVGVCILRGVTNNLQEFEQVFNGKSFEEIDMEKLGENVAVELLKVCPENFFKYVDGGDEFDFNDN